METKSLGEECQRALYPSWVKQHGREMPAWMGKQLYAHVFFSGEETYFPSTHEGSFHVITWLDADVVCALSPSSLESMIDGLWK